MLLVLFQYQSYVQLTLLETASRAYYRGNPESLHVERRQKLADARHRRKEKNLRLRQPTLPLCAAVASTDKRMGSCPSWQVGGKMLTIIR